MNILDGVTNDDQRVIEIITHPFCIGVTVIIISLLIFFIGFLLGRLSR